MTTQFCNNPVTIVGFPEAMVSRANISPISVGLADSPIKILTTIFNISTLPVDATAFAHRLIKSQLSQLNDEVFDRSSLKADNVSESQRQMASKNSPSFLATSGSMISPPARALPNLKRNCAVISNAKLPKLNQILYVQDIELTQFYKSYLFRTLQLYIRRKYVYLSSLVSVCANSTNRSSIFVFF